MPTKTSQRPSPAKTRRPRAVRPSPPRKSPGKVLTLEQARDFVLRENVVTVLSNKVPGVASLWDAVGLPDKQPGEGGWGRKMVAVWTWKTQLPASYPDEIYYGKIAGGVAVLMSLTHLRQKHYPENHRDLSRCSLLARSIYEIIRLDADQTGALRKKCLSKFGCTRAAFEKALKELQVTLNIVRSNAPEAINDTWLPFSELYLDIYNEQRKR